MIFDNSKNIMTEAEIIHEYIKDFNSSEEKKWMILGDKYYKNKNDILRRKFLRNGIEDKDKINNRLPHPFLKLQIDEKVNYLLAKPYSITSTNEEYSRKVSEVLTKRFQHTLNKLGKESSKKGIAWLHVYYDSIGKFRTMVIPSEQIIPLWCDADEEELDAVIRVYEQEVYTGKKKDIITKIEYWTKDNVEYYILDGEKIILDSERYLKEDYFGHYLLNGQPSSFEKVPFVPFKNNDEMTSDLLYIKDLVDAYDKNRSNMDCLLDEVREHVTLLKGYGGEDKHQFQSDIKHYGIVLLDEDGDMNFLTPSIDVNASESHGKQLRKDIAKSGQSVDFGDDESMGNISGIALKIKFRSLDLKCNDLEVSFKNAFSHLLYFINIYLADTNQGIYVDEEADIEFTRQVLVNENELIQSINNAQMSGLVSDDTLMAKHPYVHNVAEEKEKLEAQNKEQSPLYTFDE